VTTTLNKEFSDFCAQRDAANTLQLNVIKHTWMLCDALRQNFIDYSIRSHKSAIVKGENIDYHIACIQELRNGKCEYDFTFESGKKYHKVIMSANGAKSVHCFIDKKTGEVYKSASWKSPAKGVRYDLRIIEQREWLFENADWAGGYLYAK
jgi:hypothetical protein